MEKEKLIEELKKKSDVKIYADYAMEDPSIIPALLEIIETDKTAVKFMCEKVIRALSETNPKNLYPFFERMAMFLNSENSFIQWGFLMSIPNILKVDSAHKWENIRKQYLSFFDNNAISPFGNAVSAVPKILQQYPGDETMILPKLLKIDEHVFLYKGEKSAECLNVAKGHIIDCLDKIYPASKFQKEINEFVSSNINNSRNQVRIKVKKFLAKYSLNNPWQKK